MLVVMNGALRVSSMMVKTVNPVHLQETKRIPQLVSLGSSKLYIENVYTDVISFTAKMR